jgi:F420-dependent oxidoreductase-like protein
MTHPVRFGVTLPQFGTDWRHVREIAQAADEGGLDSIWVVDHFIGFPDPSEGVFESWTELSAIASLTQQVRIGQMVMCVGYRSPALLAKMAATLDHVSDGRVIVGLGAGWLGAEYEQYGYRFPPIGERLAQLDETCRILRAMWTEDRSTFEGKHFRVQDAVCNPKPLQRPLPIMIGGSGERVLLRHVARHADIWNNLGAYHAETPRKLEILAKHCRDLGRDFAEIEISQQTLAAIATDKATAERKKNAVLEELPFLAGDRDLILAGTPDQIRARVETNRGLGITTFLMGFGHHPDPEDVRLFAHEVAAAYR